MICDFCNTPDPPHVIACETFDVKHMVEDFPMTSLTDWWACDECFVFIEAEDKEGLFQRTKQRYIDKMFPGDTWDERIDPYLWEFHKQFWENRK